MEKYTAETHEDGNNFKYETITNDENKVRKYVLKNDLTVFLAQNFDAPKIQTYIAVKAGSNNDPAENTGLAHYLEHMMFKGTSKIGTADWEKEKPILDKISNLFEVHKKETDAQKKKEIYSEIDRLSRDAAKFALANEYDKAVSSLGAMGTNAHTWLDETVYKNNIPANELEKWLKIECERFSGITLRLFHTELESVYEEFNRAQDNDARLVNNALMEMLFPKHPNGQQTTLGKAEHLKNPSMKAIHEYFEEYYVPNNIAMVLVGDLDFDKTILLIDQYFGKFPEKPLRERKKIVEQPLTEIKSATVQSPSIPRLQLAWRTDSYGTRESLLADICANILSNSGDAGLIDLNINQSQKTLWTQAFATAFKEYGYFSVMAVPREDQRFDDALALVFEQINLLKSGDFPDDLLPAIITDFKIKRTKALETADGLATNLYDAFIKNRSWAQEMAEIDEYSKITKAEVTAFAKDFFKENYAIVYKERGINENLIRVENRGIAPIELNRGETSKFLQEILNEKSPEIQPVFIDYQKEISVEKIGGKTVSFVPNQYNNLAQTHYIFPFGTDNDKQLPLAIHLLHYIGNEHFSAEDFKKKFFALGMTTDVQITADRLMVSLSGLEENMQRGLRLLRELFENPQPDEAVFSEYISTTMETRNAAKKDKNRVVAALNSYVKFGAFSKFTDVVSDARLRQLTCAEMTEKLKKLFHFPHEVFFYGKDFSAFKNYIKDVLVAETETVPPAKIYPEKETAGEIFFADYDMVQVEVVQAAKGGAVDPRDFGKINIFNEYFGRGLSSVVFQEIRESKSLAYSAHVSYVANPELQHPDYVTSYIGTQPDKLGVALKTLEDLVLNMPEIPLQFENAKKSALKQIAASRINRTNIFFNYQSLKKLGINHDLRRDIYAEIQRTDLAALGDFYEKNVQNLRFNTAILGRQEILDRAETEKLGEIRELGLEEIFGY